MTRLDENRAKSQLAKRAGVPVAEVTSLGIWGNHSATQFPDFGHALVGGRPATEAIDDRAWLEGDFLTTVQKRGAAIIEARGASSAASAANAAVDTVADLVRATPAGDCVSVAVCSSGQYGTPEGLQFGFPVRADGQGDWSVVEGLEHDAFATERIKITTEELESERHEVEQLGLLS
jgi:malate dehydrogenase